MSDLISRQGAINALENTDCELSSTQWDELTDAIMQLPSAQKKGKWIFKKDVIGNSYGRCSECGMIQYAGQLNYCPKCGADMRKEVK